MFVLKIAEAHAKVESAAQSFLNVLFPSVVAHLTLNRNLNSSLLVSWKENFLWKFDDVRYYTLVNLRYLSCFIIISSFS